METAVLIALFFLTLSMFVLAILPQVGKEKNVDLGVPTVVLSIGFMFLSMLTLIFGAENWGRQLAKENLRLADGNPSISGTVTDIYDKATSDGINTYVVLHKEGGQVAMNLDNEDNSIADVEYLRNNLRIGDSVSCIVAPVEDSLNEVYGFIRITDNATPNSADAADNTDRNQ